MPKQILFIFSLFLIILIGCDRVDRRGQSEVTADFNYQQETHSHPLLVPPSGRGGDERDVSEGMIESKLQLEASLRQKVKETVKESVEAVEEVVADVKNENLVEGLPETFDQEMAFSRQAPFGNWDDPFLQDACEEASLITVDKFFKGLPLDERIMQEELNKVKPWELEHFGENISINTDEVAIMAEEYFSLKAEVSSEVTVERIKKEIAAGNLIILPLTGREIGNPYYTGEGPLYHMLVVKGYDRDQFITNDPGTRRGKDYKYKYDVLIQATHDWNDGDIYSGERVMIIIKN